MEEASRPSCRPSFLLSLSVSSSPPPQVEASIHRFFSLFFFFFFFLGDISALLKSMHYFRCVPLHLLFFSLFLPQSFFFLLCPVFFFSRAMEVRFFQFDWRKKSGWIIFFFFSSIKQMFRFLSSLSCPPFCLSSSARQMKLRLLQVNRKKEEEERELAE